MDNPPNRVRPIQNDAEFQAIDALYAACFGAVAVPTERQKSWWECQPTGILGLVDDGILWGGLSYWMLSKKTYKSLISGHLREKNILPTDLEIALHEPKSAYFAYLSEVAIQPEHRKKGLGDVLMREMFAEIESLCPTDTCVTVLALVFSQGGHALLTRFGFKKIREAQDMADGMDLYAWTRERTT